ncbi:MAG: NAD-dependent epimerase/dehydratase family protein [Lentisphaerae bacterium]|nr:NAD-dependent epimerase/dehydratase family protein [Lentisphaerota bacterium]
MKKILLTGVAGFIGYHLFQRLRNENFEIVSLDNLNNYYDINLKLSRLAKAGFNVKKIACGRMIEANGGGRFIQLDLDDSAAISDLFHNEKFDAVCHLAAQAGVRFSIENPALYVKSNINGFINILEECRKNHIKNLLFASSSSVYGNTQHLPFSENDPLCSPASIYAATKLNNEIMAACYREFYGLRPIGLRFFTVYGPWGRPDMAIFKFTDAILNGHPIDVYNFGNMQRDFTYIDDIVEGITRIIKKVLTDNRFCARNIYNIGNGQPVGLMDFIRIIEKTTGKKAILNLLPLQPGDVYQTWADTENLQNDFGFKPETSLKKGVENFVSWYMQFYNKNQVF